MLLALDEVTQKNIVIVLAEHPFKTVANLIYKIESCIGKEFTEVDDNDIKLIKAVCDEAPHKVAVAVLNPLSVAIDNSKRKEELVDDADIKEVNDLPKDIIDRI